MRNTLFEEEKLHLLRTFGSRPNNNQPSRPKYTDCWSWRVFNFNMDNGGFASIFHMSDEGFLFIYHYYFYFFLTGLYYKTQFSGFSDENHTSQIISFFIFFFFETIKLNIFIYFLLSGYILTWSYLIYVVTFSNIN